MKNVIFGGSILIFLSMLALSIMGIRYWRYSQHYVSTKEAYVNANVVRVAPRVTGQVAHLHVVNNQYVKKGDRLFELDTATFLLSLISRPGQKAVIKVDTYPDHSFKGVVESISRGTGTAFSLLSSQNATGNWVKITQRVPVRVRVLDLNQKYPLRIGTTATVTIEIDSNHVIK